MMILENLPRMGSPITMTLPMDGLKSFRTCSEEERIEKVNVELEDCKAEAESLGAAHIYWQAEWQRPVHTTPLCHIYGTCNGGSLRTPAENGVNMVLI